MDDKDYGKSPTVGDTIGLYSSDKEGIVTKIKYDPDNVMNIYSIDFKDGTSGIVTEEDVILLTNKGGSNG